MYRDIFHLLATRRFLRLQSIVLFFVLLIDWMLMPVMTKLEGMYLPIYMISFFLLLGATDGLLQPLFKETRISTIYLFAIFLDMIQIAAYSVYAIDEQLFTYLMLGIFTLQGITFDIARVHTIDFMQNDIDLKDFMIVRSFIISVAIITGSLFIMAYDYFYGDVAFLLQVLAVLGVAVLPFGFKLYLEFKRRSN